MSSQKRVIVVGGGLAGLAASIKLAEEGIPVDLISMVPVKRSHSVCAQGGINACNDVARQQGFSEWVHMDETLYGGDFLAHQPPVYEMTHWAPRVIDLFDRMGVPFNRTLEGNCDLRLFGGSLFRRTFFAGATTGQQLLYALDEQTRRYEAEGRITKYEFWEFLWPVLDADGVCRGCVAQDMRSMEIRAFPADAVVMATGGNGLVFGQSTNSIVCTGAAAARCYQAGAWYANGEFIQVHPTAIPGADKCRLMSESARGEGGRIWVPRQAGDQRDPREIPEGERWYFLEEKYPKYGNLVPRDIATREIFDVCVNEGLGVGGGNMVYLDLSHKPKDYLETKLGGILEIYRKFAGDDPTEVPMKIFPAVHYTMGGMWTTYTPQDDNKGMVKGAPNTMMTNIQGLYALGEVNYQFHGATRLGANALLSCTFDGLFAGQGIANYVREESTAAGDMDGGMFNNVVDQEKAKLKAMTDSSGDENPYAIAREMGLEMTAASTVVKTEDRMNEALKVLHELQDRYQRIGLADHGLWTNQNLGFARAVGDMLLLAEPILVGGINRKESRGSHFRPDYPDRNDEKFLKTTVAKYNADTKRPDMSYENIIMGLVEPRARTYGKVDG
ncbi:MAG: succinate dehydrogenase flavoprotein subunit [Planctomycetes bacterium]|nr:succinate dehydrogenase flavoprotein subunit [Planctomycetota bacterium]NOG55980.1 succinate dehydrogenase flavoprotein subunit [Planctomycetota bacterium]